MSSMYLYPAEYGGFSTAAIQLELQLYPFLSLKASNCDFSVTVGQGSIYLSYRCYLLSQIRLLLLSLICHYSLSPENERERDETTGTKTTDLRELSAL